MAKNEHRQQPLWNDSELLNHLQGVL